MFIAVFMGQDDVCLLAAVFQAGVSEIELLSCPS